MSAGWAATSSPSSSPTRRAAEEVEQLADRIIVAIKEPYMIDQTEIRIGVSIGCAFGPIDGATVDDLILKADLALYEAKDAGRGVARYFSSALQSEQEDRVRLETDLRQAHRVQAVPPRLPALVNAKTQKLIGFEALIRWNHPQRGFVPPNVFIPVAEEAGLMPAIGEWVIDEACRAVATWPDPITRRAQHQPEADRAAVAPQHRQRGAWPPQDRRATGSSSKSPKACSSATTARRSTC